MATPTTRYARNGDTHIAYQVLGDGPVDLLLAPGFISHLDLNWTMPPYVDFVEGLARFARVILFDKRGTGLSDVSPDASSFEARMTDIGAVLDAVGSERAILLGLSEGGPLAALFAATHPERVQSLVLYGTFPGGAFISPRMLDRFEEAVDQWGEGHTAGIFLGGSDGPVVRRFTALFERAAASPGMARALIRSIRQCDVSGILVDVHVPTLVLHRSQDPFAEVAGGRRMAEAIPGARFVEIDGSDHLPWMGDAQAVVGAVHEFVTGRSDAPVSRCTLATVLFTDIVASTEQLAAMGDERWAETIQHHNDACRDVFADLDAWGVKSTGDGFMACLATPEKGVLCAQRLRSATAAIGLQIRVGLNTGELERVDVDDVAGMTVNIAARVADLAGPGEILATQAASDLLVGSRQSIEERGRHQLKGLPRPVSLVAIGDESSAAGDVEEVTPRRTRRLDDLTLRVVRRAPWLLRGAARLVPA